MFTLYAAKNTVAVASHIALEETGLPYTLAWIDFAKTQQQSDAYRAINPKGRVPALVTGDDIITETPAILEFIAETAGALLPEGTLPRARVRELMSYCGSTFHVNHAHKLRGERWSDDAAAHASMSAKVPQTMAESCAFVESQLSGGWFATDYSIADIHLYSVCRWLEGDAVDITAFPRLNAHFQAMQNRPAVQRIEAAHG